MADVQSDTHPHKAKDGKWYPTYMEKVSANIAVNERVLREKGLDKAVKTLKKANCTNRNKMKAAREKKQPQRLASLANQENSSPSVRRSTRVRKKPAENKGLPDDFKEPSKQQLAAADKKRAAEETKEEKEWKRQRTQRLQAYKKAGMLTEQDRKYVDKIGWWREMKEFLLNEQKISDQNFVSEPSLSWRRSPTGPSLWYHLYSFHLHISSYCPHLSPHESTTIHTTTFPN